MQSEEREQGGDLADPGDPWQVSDLLAVALVYKSSSVRSHTLWRMDDVPLLWKFSCQIKYIRWESDSH